MRRYVSTCWSFCSALVCWLIRLDISLQLIHPGKLTWNLTITYIWKGKSSSKPPFLFNVDFPGCISLFYPRKPQQVWLHYGCFQLLSADGCNRGVSEFLKIPLLVWKGPFWRLMFKHDWCFSSNCFWGCHIIIYCFWQIHLYNPIYILYIHTLTLGFGLQHLHSVSQMNIWRISILKLEGQPTKIGCGQWGCMYIYTYLEPKSPLF